MEACGGGGVVLSSCVLQQQPVLNNDRWCAFRPRRPLHLRPHIQVASCASGTADSGAFKWPEAWEGDVLTFSELGGAASGGAACDVTRALHRQVWRPNTLKFM